MNDSLLLNLTQSQAEQQVQPEACHGKKTERLVGRKKYTKNYFAISFSPSIFNYDRQKEMKTSPRLFECLFTHSLPLSSSSSQVLADRKLFCLLFVLR